MVLASISPAVAQKAHYKQATVAVEARSAYVVSHFQGIALACKNDGGLRVVSRNRMNMSVVCMATYKEDSRKMESYMRANPGI